MTAPEVVSQAAARGVSLTLVEGRLKYESALPVPASVFGMLREHKAELITYLLEQPPEPVKAPEPKTLTLDEEAATILAELRSEPLTPSQWLDLVEAARLEAVVTFPPERQHNALKDYVANNCKGRSAPLIAAHTVALHLWARRRRVVTIGECQDAACEALGLEPESIVRDRVIRKRGRP